MKRYLKILFLILWMIIIFLFSSQNGSESSETSQTVVFILNNMGIKIDSIYGNTFNLLIRKSAHMFEYFVLCILFYYVLKDFINRKIVILSLFFSFLYACCDEIHQYFVPMRACSFIDVIIDTIGALLGIMFIMFLKLISTRLLKKDKKI